MNEEQLKIRRLNENDFDVVRNERETRLEYNKYEQYKVTNAITSDKDPIGNNCVFYVIKSILQSENKNTNLNDIKTAFSTSSLYSSDIRDFFNKHGYNTEVISSSLDEVNARITSEKYYHAIIINFTSHLHCVLFIGLHNEVWDPLIQKMQKIVLFWDPYDGIKVNYYDDFDASRKQAKKEVIFISRNYKDDDDIIKYIKKISE